MQTKGNDTNYLQEIWKDYQAIDESRKTYDAIRRVNKASRMLKAMNRGEAWEEHPSGWAWVHTKLIELTEFIGFELLLILKKVLFVFAVLAGWGLLLAIVILWLGGFP